MLPILLLKLNEIIEGDGFHALYFQITSDPVTHNEVDAGGFLRVGIFSEDAWKYEPGRLYDLNLQPIEE